MKEKKVKLVDSHKAHAKTTWNIPRNNLLTGYNDKLHLSK